MFTLPTPENDGWKSPSPLPRSFLPPEKDETATRPAASSEVPVELDRTARKEALLKAMRRTPSLSALSTALGLQQAGPRPATFISTTLSRTQIASTLPNLARRPSVADPAVILPKIQRTKSGLPSLAALGERLAGMKERSMLKGSEPKKGEVDTEKKSERAEGLRDEVIEEHATVEASMVEGDTENAAATSLPTHTSSSTLADPPSEAPVSATAPEAARLTSSVPSIAPLPAPTPAPAPSFAPPSIPVSSTPHSHPTPSLYRNSLPTSSTVSPPRNPASHPLEHEWTFFFHPATSTSASMSTYAAGQKIATVDTVEDLCPLLSWLKRPSQLEMGSAISVFKDGIKPVWEDEANANGGKWTLTILNNTALLDRCWTWLVLALLGEELDDRNQVCGAVISPRPQGARIQLWTRSQYSIEPLNALAKRLLKLLDLSTQPGTSLDFSPHLSSTTVVPNHFLSISHAPLPASPGYASEGGSRRAVEEGSARRFEGSRGWRERNGGGIQGGVLGNLGALGEKK